MKSQRQPRSPLEQVADASAKMKLFEELGKGAALLNKIRNNFPARTDERRLLKLILNAQFYITVRQFDGFCDFLTKMEAVDVGSSKKRNARVSKRNGVSPE